MFNGCGKDDKFSISLSTKGAVDIIGKSTQSLNIAEKGELSVYFPVKAKSEMGKVSFIVSAKGAGEYSQKLGRHVRFSSR